MTDKLQPLPGFVLKGAGFLIFFILFFKNAWVAEDAYITFRSLEQLFASNGPVWNAGERVQAFTSTLWYWLLAVPRIFSGDHFINTIGVSALLMVLMLYWLDRFSGNATTLLIAIFLLAASNGFFDFTSSGLENPLAYLLLTAFYYHFFRLVRSDAPRRSLSWLYNLFFLILLTRHDLLLITLPVLLYASVQHWGSMPIRNWLTVLLVSATPFAIWSVFSVIYYGTPLPNTAYAKLDHGIPAEQMIIQGLLYLRHTLVHDFITLFVLLSVVVYCFASGRRYLAAVGGGLILNVMYVVYVGGDFMQGRFFSFGYLVAVMVIMHIVPTDKPLMLRTAIPALLIYVFFYPHTPLTSPANYSNQDFVWGIADERGYYFPTNSIHAYLDYQTMDERPPYFPITVTSGFGYQWSRQDSLVVTVRGIGMFGFWAGVDTPVIEAHALSNPFLARLPASNEAPWRIGHFTRAFPAGYIETVATGKSQFEDQQLGEFFELVRLVTGSEDLLSNERMRAIWCLNTGCYRALISHLQHPPESYVNMALLADP